jgi:DNA-binding beta-propeller fold protein YncE
MNQNKSASTPGRRLLLTAFAILIVACPVLTALAQTEADISTPEANLPKNKVLTTITVGAGPNSIVVSPNNDLVYVANLLDNTVSVIDAKTNKIKKGSPYSANTAPLSMAITPDGQELYISNYTYLESSSTVTILNAETGAIVKTVPIPRIARYLAITPNGKEVWVPNLSSGSQTGTISVIDTKTKEVNSFALGAQPESVAFARRGKTAYVIDAGVEGVGGLYTVNTATKETIGYISSQYVYGTWCAVNPKGKKDVYVDYPSTINELGFTGITVVQGGNVAATISTTEYPAHFAVTKNGRYLYVPFSNIGIDNFGTTVVMYDTTTYAPVGDPITVGNAPSLVAIAPDQKRAYVSNFKDGTVSVIDIQP